MIDTTEAGGGSYPEPPEPKEKCYTFRCDCSVIGEISIYADNLEKAEDMLKAGEWNDGDFYEYKIEDILSYKLEEGR